MSKGKLPQPVEKLLDTLYDEKIKEYKTLRKIRPGMLLLYGYDAKYKDTLKYWDALPVMLLMYMDGKHIAGLNLHYIPWTYRINFAKYLFEEQKGHITWKGIKRAWRKAKIPGAYAYYAYRKYLISHIRTSIKVFNKETYLPVVKNVLPEFKKMEDAMIYADIRRRLKEASMKNRKKVSVRRRKK